MIIRLAKKEDMEQVYRLTHDMYVEAGYCKPQPNGLLRHYPHLDDIPQTIVFVAEQDGKIVGTNSLTFDGPAKLHVDEDFPEEVEKIRRICNMTGRKLAASWRLATHPKARNSLRVVLELINATMTEGSNRHMNLLLFTFNPKHEGFYEKLLGLKTIATSERCEAVSAPGVLMKGDARYMVNKWVRFCKKRKLATDANIKNVWWPWYIKHDLQTVA
jgi:hypothetical protein